MRGLVIILVIMSQKKLKKLKKENNQKQIVLEEKVMGIREIIKKNWKFLVILLIGVVVIYFNSLNGAFVSDDYATIPQNSGIMSVKAGMNSSFFVNFFKTGIALIFGIKSPIPYHVACLIIYLLICLFAFVFLSLFFEGIVPKIALIIFAVLPVHVEAVSWISGIPYLLTSLLVLMELTNLVLFFVKKNKKYLVSFLILFLISIFTDRIRGFSVILLFGLILISFSEKIKLKINLWMIISAILAAFGILLVIAWPLILGRVESVNSGINASESVFYNPFFQYPTAMAKYLQLILFPIDLTLYHTMYTIPVWLNWLIVTTYLAAVIWYYFKNKKIFFALAFIFVATAPSMAPIKVSWLVAERYIFLGSLGVSLLIALFAERYWQRRKNIIIVLLSIIILAYGIRVIFRNINWQTNHNLWVSSCQVSPNSHNAWNNIGDDYDKLGQYENAIKGFAQSFAIKPNYADAYHNQANILYKIGRLDLARKGYEIALSYNPGLSQTYMTLIQLDLMEKNESALLDHLGKLQKLQPNDLQVAFVTASAYAQIGKVDEAKQMATMMYQQFPNISQIKDLYESLTKLEPEKKNSPVISR